MKLKTHDSKCKSSYQNIIQGLCGLKNPTQNTQLKQILFGKNNNGQISLRLYILLEKGAPRCVAVLF